MYVVPPPQRSDSGSNGDLRVYQTWKGSNVSFFIYFYFLYWHLIVYVVLELTQLDHSSYFLLWISLFLVEVSPLMGLRLALFPIST